MNDPALSLVWAIVMGLGATLTIDLWGWLLQYVFKAAPSNLCLVGRWLRYLPEGIFIHSNLGSAPRKSAECTAGWIAHYIIGILFAVTFVGLTGSSWLRCPTPIPALLFGAGSVLAPFFIMQPLFGLGIAAARTPNAMQIRLRSLMNHMVFGMGLYLFGLLVSRFLGAGIC